MNPHNKTVLEHDLGGGFDVIRGALGDWDMRHPGDDGRDLYAAGERLKAALQQLMYAFIELGNGADTLVEQLGELRRKLEQGERLRDAAAEEGYTRGYDAGLEDGGAVEDTEVTDIATAVRHWHEDHHDQGWAVCPDPLCRRLAR